MTVAARFQEAALLCRADGDVRGPADLAGRRIGVRAYSQTTGMWLRGILADDYGVRPEAMRWVTFEDAHVAEAQDPPWAERAPAGKELLAHAAGGRAGRGDRRQRRAGRPGLRTVFPDPAAAGAAFLRRHGFVPVNHLVVVRRELAEERPELVVELLRLFRDAKAAAPPPDGGVDPLPAGRAALRPALELASRYAPSRA